MANAKIIKIGDLKKKLDEIDKRYVTQKNQRDTLTRQLAMAEQEVLKILGEYRAVRNLIKKCEEKNG